MGDFLTGAKDSREVTEKKKTLRDSWMATLIKCLKCKMRTCI